MQRLPITLAEFSRFTILHSVQQADRTLLSGRITKPGRLSCGQSLGMFLSLEDSVHGVLTELDPDAGTGVLNVVTENLHPAMRSGATFPGHDSYWVGKLRLVLDKDIRWRRMQFVAPDAFV